MRTTLATMFCLLLTTAAFGQTFSQSTATTTTVTEPPVLAAPVFVQPVQPAFFAFQAAPVCGHALGYSCGNALIGSELVLGRRFRGVGVGGGASAVAASGGGGGGRGVRGKRGGANVAVAAPNARRVKVKVR